MYKWLVFKYNRVFFDITLKAGLVRIAKSIEDPCVACSTFFANSSFESSRIMKNFVKLVVRSLEFEKQLSDLSVR